MVVVTGNLRGQTMEWMYENGKAKFQAVISAPGKDATALYKQVNRWVAKTFKNSESVVKSRIDGEYLAGVAYHADFHKLGELSATDVRYNFSIEIKDEKVRITFYNGVVLYDNPLNPNSARKVESYFNSLNRKKRDQHAVETLGSLNSLSASLLESLESFLSAETVRHDEW